MGIGGDRDHHTGRTRKPRMGVAHVEPVRLAVDLHCRARFGGTGGDSFEVELGAWSARDQTTRKVSDAVNVRVLDRRENSLGWIPIERGVERCHDPVELHENRVLDIDLALGGDVRLNAAENPEAF